MIVEMRTYRLKPGLREEFLRLFRSKMLPALAASGIKSLGPFPSLDDPDTFFCIRGFPDRRSHEPMRAMLHNHSLWTSELKGRFLPMLDNYEIVVLEDSHGVIHW